MKFAWKGTFEALMVKFGGEIGTLYICSKTRYKKHPLQNRTNVQIKGGEGGSKAFWTMFKKTALFLSDGFPYWITCSGTLATLPWGADPMISTGLSQWCSMLVSFSSFLACLSLSLFILLFVAAVSLARGKKKANKSCIFRLYFF